MRAGELREKIGLLAPRPELPVVIVVHDESGVFVELPVSAISFDGRRVVLHASKRDAAF